jgi:hypothetical protein
MASNPLADLLGAAVSEVESGAAPPKVPPKPPVSTQKPTFNADVALKNIERPAVVVSTFGSGTAPRDESGMAGFRSLHRETAIQPTATPAPDEGKADDAPPPAVDEFEDEQITLEIGSAARTRDDDDEFDEFDQEFGNCAIPSSLPTAPPPSRPQPAAATVATAAAAAATATQVSSVGVSGDTEDRQALQEAAERAASKAAEAAEAAAQEARLAAQAERAAALKSVSQAASGSDSAAAMPTTSAKSAAERADDNYAASRKVCAAFLQGSHERAHHQSPPPSPNSHCGVPTYASQKPNPMRTSRRTRLPSLRKRRRRDGVRKGAMTPLNAVAKEVRAVGLSVAASTAVRAPKGVAATARRHRPLCHHRQPGRAGRRSGCFGNSTRRPRRPMRRKLPREGRRTQTRIGRRRLGTRRRRSRWWRSSHRRPSVGLCARNGAAHRYSSGRSHASVPN